MRLSIDRYLTDTATWTHGGTRDSFGRTSGATVEEIPVRWLHATELVRGDDGREVVSSAQISTTAEVRVGDVITDERGVEREIILVRTAQDVRGNFSHYVARLAAQRST